MKSSIGIRSCNFHSAILWTTVISFSLFCVGSQKSFLYTQKIRKITITAESATMIVESGKRFTKMFVVMIFDFSKLHSFRLLILTTVRIKKKELVVFSKILLQISGLFRIWFIFWKWILVVWNICYINATIWRKITYI